jgi:mRNA-degrading endonuclease RelE of RelBE toxin-antitoxin system
MVEIIRRSAFEQAVKHIKDRKLKERIKKQITKIVEDPERAGRFPRHDRKFEKKIYIPPFRLIFAYDREKNIIYLIDFDKRDRVYEKR